MQPNKLNEKMQGMRFRDALLSAIAGLTIHCQTEGSSRILKLVAKSKRATDDSQYDRTVKLHANKLEGIINDGVPIEPYEMQALMEAFSPTVRLNKWDLELALENLYLELEKVTSKEVADKVMMDSIGVAYASDFHFKLKAMAERIEQLEVENAKLTNTIEMLNASPSGWDEQKIALARKEGYREGLAASASKQSGTFSTKVNDEVSNVLPFKVK